MGEHPRLKAIRVLLAHQRPVTLKSAPGGDAAEGGVRRASDSGRHAAVMERPVLDFVALNAEQRRKVLVRMSPRSAASRSGTRGRADAA